MNQQNTIVSLFFLLFNCPAMAMEKPSALVSLAGGELSRNSLTYGCVQELNEPVAHGARLGAFVLFGLGSGINGMAGLPALIKPELSLGMLVLGNSLVYLANKTERVAWEALYEQQKSDLNLTKEEFTKNHGGLRAVWS